MMHEDGRKKDLENKQLKNQILNKRINERET